MGERHGPRLVHFLDELGENDAKGHARRIGLVEADRIVHVLDAVPEIDDRVAAELGQALLVGPLADAALEPELRMDVPMRAEVVRDLTVDGADAALRLFVGELAVGVIDDGNQHGVNLVSRVLL